jgi:hypothetical protein
MWEELERDEKMRDKIASGDFEWAHNPWKSPEVVDAINKGRYVFDPITWHFPFKVPKEWKPGMLVIVIQTVLDEAPNTIIPSTTFGRGALVAIALLITLIAIGTFLL